MYARQHKRWTEQEEDYLVSVIEDVELGYVKLKDISEELGRSYDSVKSKYKRFGGKPISLNLYTLYKGDQVIVTGTINEIAEKQNVKTSSLRKYQNKTYWKSRKNPLRLIKVS